ncbi:type VII secretion-associated protein [Gordonia sp. VNQ95]|uniref:type VII secretion-associated protein n=1 Tax=Gordonia TaxID=2053 RepID=UPI0032B4E2F9
MTATTAPPRAHPPAPVVSRRATVIDLAYGQVVLGDAGAGPDVSALLNAIDADTIVVDGVAAPAPARWAAVFAAIAESVGWTPLILTHPSTWGSVRTGVLRRAAAMVPTDIDVLPRAVQIARTHADVTVSRCAVVETTALPDHDDGRRSPRWDVQRLRRIPTGWEIEASGILRAVGDATDSAAVQAVIDDGVEAVFVDGVTAAEVTRAVDTITEHTVAGRVVRVDRRLVTRAPSTAGSAGSAATDPAWADAAAEAMPSTSRAGRRRWAWAAAAMAAVIVVAIAGLVGIVQTDESPPPTPLAVTVGRTSMLIPPAWHRDDPPAPGSAPASPATRSPSQSRTVFVAPDDGARLILVQSPIRAGSTPASVGVSMGNRIGQRGDDVVSEFSPSTRFAGRDVISYREAPASGAPIRWYVLVEHDLQVSIGCQAGTGGQSVDGPCVQAVESARIAAR